MKRLFLLVALSLPVWSFAQTSKPSERESRAGVTDDKIVIGTVLPASGSLAEMGQVGKALLIAYFDELNSQGGIYNRKIELKFAETSDTPAATRANVERLLIEQQPFALVGGFIASADKEIASLMSEREVPLIGPLTLWPQIPSPLNRQVFYVLSGVEGQARALVKFAAQKPELKNSASAIIYSSTALNASVADAIKQQSKTDGLQAPQTYEYASGSFDAAQTARQLKQNHQELVFFLGSSEQLLTLLAEAHKAAWFPSVFVTAGASNMDIFNAPAGFADKILVAFPTTPADQTPEGLKQFRALAEKYKLPANRMAAQVYVYAAARILAEGLRRAGRDVTREKLIQALEGLRDYQTGLTPAITYGPTRRVGASGAYIVGVDLKQKQFLVVSAWIAVN